MPAEYPAFVSTLSAVSGKSSTFDSIECMAAYYLSRTKPGEVRALFVADHARPGHRLRAEQAWYLKSGGLPSPMGLDFSAYSTAEAARAARKRHGGEVLDWMQVLERVRRAWLRPYAR
jgi:copper chaperone NosL